MNNNAILYTLRHSLPLTGEQMSTVFGLGGHTVSALEVEALMERDDREEAASCSDAMLIDFLDGFILQQRGPRKQGAAPAPPPALSNNTIFKKLRIALNLHEADVLAILAEGGRHLTKRELTPLFRKPDHKHYRSCDDEVLEGFFKGLRSRRAS